MNPACVLLLSIFCWCCFAFTPDPVGVAPEQLVGKWMCTDYSENGVMTEKLDSATYWLHENGTFTFTHGVPKASDSTHAEGAWHYVREKNQLRLMWTEEKSDRDESCTVDFLDEKLLKLSTFKNYNGFGVTVNMRFEKLP